MSNKVVLLLYKTIFKKLKKLDNSEGIQLLKKTTRLNKDITNQKLIEHNIQLLLDNLLFVNRLEIRNK